MAVKGASEVPVAVVVRAASEGPVVDKEDSEALAAVKEASADLGANKAASVDQVVNKVDSGDITEDKEVLEVPVAKVSAVKEVLAVREASAAREDLVVTAGAAGDDTKQGACHAAAVVMV